MDYDVIFILDGSRHSRTLLSALIKNRVGSALVSRLNVCLFRVSVCVLACIFRVSVWTFRGSG